MTRAVLLGIVSAGCGNLAEVAEDAGPAPCRAIAADFDAVAAEEAPVDASAYLEGVGVAIDSTAPEGTEVVIASEDLFYDGVAARAASPPNLLTQIQTESGPPIHPMSYTLRLCAPASRIRFARAKLIAGPSGIIHPAWSAHAFDGDGDEVGTASEDQITSYVDVPATLYSIDAYEIVTIRFDSDGEGVAAFGALLLDDLSAEVR
jgi:dipeptidyl aminopeptidase/acylaminoacyl peptidase